MNHRSFFEGPMMPLTAPDVWGGAEEDAVFEGSIDCNPYDTDPRLRVPVVNLQVCVGRWISGWTHSESPRSPRSSVPTPTCSTRRSAPRSSPPARTGPPTTRINHRLSEEVVVSAPRSSPLTKARRTARATPRRQPVPRPVPPRPARSRGRRPHPRSPLGRAAGRRCQRALAPAWTVDAAAKAWGTELPRSGSATSS